MPLTSQLGVRQILWMGSTVPLPAPYEVLQALTSVEVTNDNEAGDGFQLVFALHKDRTLDYGLLKNAVFAPGNRVVLGVVLGIVPEVLIDGVITHHQVKVSGGAGGELTVTGKDITSAMDLEERNSGFDNQPDSVIATRIIAGYPQFGLVPAVTPTTDVPIQTDRVPSQQETDLAFLRRTAERNGFVFYIEPISFGVNKAYWGPENRLGVPQPALTQDMGAATNLRALDFSHDSLGPVAPTGVFVEPFFKLSIPIPPLPSLKIPPLARLARAGDAAHHRAGRGEPEPAAGRDRGRRCGHEHRQRRQRRRRGGHGEVRPRPAGPAAGRCPRGRADLRRVVQRRIGDPQADRAATTRSVSGSAAKGPAPPCRR